MKFQNPVPIYRIFDVEKAKEFYVGFLGFQVDWEHRFGDDFPLYLQVSLENFTLHLSEHHGDATPGSSLRIAVDDLRGFHQALAGKNYRYAKPGIEPGPGGDEMAVTDPFGNKIIFVAQSPAGKA